MTRSPIAIGVLMLLSVFLSATGAAAQSGFISIDDDPILGNPEATVTIIEFGDYQCPLCRIFWKETMPRIKEQYVDTGKVQIVFRDFPQEVHPEASAAAMAAECAEDQGKYWEYHDKIFRGAGPPVTGGRRRTLPHLPISSDGVRTSVWIPPHSMSASIRNGTRTEVEADYADASGVGVNGTPFFFINGRVLVRRPPVLNVRECHRRVAQPRIPERRRSDKLNVGQAAGRPDPPGGRRPPRRSARS